MSRPVPARMAILLAVALGLAACTDLPVLDPRAAQPLLPDVDCGRLSIGACDAVVADLGGDVPGSYASIELACGSDPCTRGGGSGTARVTLSDGRVEVRLWAYAGDTEPIPEPECLGIEIAICAELATREVDALPPTFPVGSIQVVCRGVRGCSEGEATVEIVVTDRLGVPHRSSGGWWRPGPDATAPPPDLKTPEP